MTRARVGHRRRVGDRSRGAVLVEFALIAPLLFALLLGSITGGIALSRKNSMTNATREGARLGATLPSSGTWAGDVVSRVVQLSGGDLTSSQVCVRLRTVTGASTSTVVQSQVNSGCSAATEPSMPTGVVVGDCYVTAWSRRTSDFETIFFSRTITLDASAVGRYERGKGATCVP